MIDFISYIAGLIGMVSFLPQVIKTIKLKSAKDVSVMMLLLTLAGNILYIIYGTALSLTPVVVMLSITTVIVLIELGLVAYYRGVDN